MMDFHLKYVSAFPILYYQLINILKYINYFSFDVTLTASNGQLTHYVKKLSEVPTPRMRQDQSISLDHNDYGAVHSIGLYYYKQIYYQRGVAG